jgi:benzoate transport
MSDSALTASQDVELIPTGSFSAKQLGLLSLCFVVTMIDGFDILIIAFAAPAIIADLALEPSGMGIVFSAGVLGMTVGAMFMSSLADIYGRKAVISGCLILSGIATLCVFYSYTVTQLVILRFVTGLGLGTLLAVLPALTGEFSPAKYRTLVLAILIACTNVGSVLGGLISSIVISSLGWKSIFFFAGLLTLVTGCIFYIVAPESMAYLSKRHSGRNALERINSSLNRIGYPAVESLPENASPSSEFASVRSLLISSRIRRTLLAWVTFFLGFSTIYFINSWLPKILVDAGLSHEQGIRGVVVVTFGAIVGSVLIGWLARWISINRLIAAAFLSGAILLVLLSGMIAAGEALNTSMVWLTLGLVGMTVVGAFSNLYSVALSLYPAEIRSTGLGWCVGLGRGGAVVSPAIAGWLASAGISMQEIIIYFAVPMVIATITIMTIENKR